MNLHRLSTSVSAAIVVLLMGCGSSAPKKELRTPTQAASFVTSVARGGASEDWQLANSGASSAATRAWAERDALYGLGMSLRSDGSAWACEFAEGSERLSSNGIFSIGDQTALIQTATTLGAKEADVKAMLADVLKLSVPDLTKATAAICP